MRAAGIVLAIFSVIMFTAMLAYAVPEGRVLEFSTPMGSVLFNGTIHAKQFDSCNACHREGVFKKMKRNEYKFTMAEMYEGKFCGSCHNGNKAFAQMDNCKRCHNY